MRYSTLIMMAACGLGCLWNSQPAHAYTVVYGIDPVPQAAVSINSCADRCISLCEVVLRESRGELPARPAVGEWSSDHTPIVASGAITVGYAVSNAVAHITDPPLVGLIPDEAVLVPIRFLDGIFRPPRR